MFRHIDSGECGQTTTPLLLNNLLVYFTFESNIERFHESRHERSFVRLDRPVRPDSGTTFHDRIGAQDPNMFLNYDGQSERIPTDRVKEILMEQLGATEFEILRQLIERTSSFYSPHEGILISEDQLRQSIPQIQEKLEVLVHRFERDGKIIIPQRPILYVRFGPKFYIKFGSTVSPIAYRGAPTPLAYFLSHLSRYKGKTELELQYADRELYEALVNTGKLQLAISFKSRELKPRGNQSRPRLTQSRVDKIVAAYETTGGNISMAARLTGEWRYTAWRCLKKKNLQGRGHGGNTRQVSRKSF